MEKCGPHSPSWFGRGSWPRCRCGYAPRDNSLLKQHWAEAGFRVVDERGILRTYPIETGEN